MTKRPLGRSGIAIEPLMFGTNVIGWTADEKTSFAVLDAFLAEGFSAVDTADVYSRWVPGNDSESEKIIGRWMKARGNRAQVVLATKVGSDMRQGRLDLRASWIVKAVEDSLTRLQTDVIDLYQTHWPDPATPEDETLGAYDTLIKAGKVRAIGTTGKTRSAVLPDVPTISESGVPGYEATIWLGLMAPKGTPKAIVDRLNEAVSKITNQAEVRATWTKQGAVAMVMTPEAFDKYARDDVAKWAKLITAAGIKAD